VRGRHGEAIPDQAAPEYYGYPAVRAVTLGICGILYVNFKRSGWL